VDRDCRVHGLANLYVAGSSVFPTAGASNPTLTIVALALRLAEHVKRVAQAGIKRTPRVEGR
jgi:choline dehydrogenase-like flavoprotein